MKLTVDTQTGSRDLIAPLRRAGAKVTETILPFGDVAIAGRGPDGRPVSVGVEFKTLADAAQCMHTGRLVGHQLPGMFDMYEMRWLLIEGASPLRTDAILFAHVVAQRRIVVTYSQFNRWLLSLQTLTNLKIARTSSRNESIAWLMDLAAWWEKPWSEHDALEQFKGKQSPIIEAGNAITLTKPGLLRRVAAEIGGIGWKKAVAVESAFASVRDMADADVEEWRAALGLGPKAQLPARIVEQITRRMR